MAQSGTFADLWSYIEKEAATLKVLECKTLKACLSTGKCWKYYKMYLALEKTFFGRTDSGDTRMGKTKLRVRCASSLSEVLCCCRSALRGDEGFGKRYIA